MIVEIESYPTKRNSLEQFGSIPDQCPSPWHTRILSPNRVSFGAHVYAASDPTVLPFMLMVPPAGLPRGPQVTAERQRNYVHQYLSPNHPNTETHLRTQDVGSPLQPPELLQTLTADPRLA